MIKKILTVSGMLLALVLVTSPVFAQTTATVVPATTTNATSTAKGSSAAVTKAYKACTGPLS